MKLSIIIVSWNTKDLTEKCLNSIQKYRVDLDWIESDSMEIIVVDNNSTDGTRATIEDLRLKIKNLKIILKDENLGFAKGNNAGLKQAKGEYVFLLNSDAEVIENSLQVLVKYLDDHQDCAVVGPKLLNPDGSLQLSVRKFPTLLSQLLILTKIHNFVPRLLTLKNYFQLDFDYDNEQEVDQLMGAALMVRKSILDEVGELDGSYKRIFEEVDLLYRIKKADHKVCYTPDAQIIHHKGASFAKTKIFRKQLDFNQGMRRFFYKHKPLWQYLVLFVFQPVSWLATGLQVILNIIGDPLRKKYKKNGL